MQIIASSETLEEIREIFDDMPIEGIQIEYVIEEDLTFGMFYITCEEDEEAEQVHNYLREHFPTESESILYNWKFWAGVFLSAFAAYSLVEFLKNI